METRVEIKASNKCTGANKMVDVLPATRVAEFEASTDKLNYNKGGTCLCTHSSVPVEPAVDVFLCNKAAMRPPVASKEGVAEPHLGVFGASNKESGLNLADARPVVNTEFLLHLICWFQARTSRV